jgi:hypothetical protein
MSPARKPKRRRLLPESTGGASVVRVHGESPTARAQPSPTDRAAIRRLLAEGAQARADRDRRVTAAWSTLTDDW